MLSGFILILHRCCRCLLFFFFFNDTATTEIYTLSLHDALPIGPGFGRQHPNDSALGETGLAGAARLLSWADRKSTRLNSSHVEISYAVFCLKKKNGIETTIPLHQALVTDADFIDDDYDVHCLVCFFFFNDTATTEIYTLSLHDALPIRLLSW